MTATGGGTLRDDYVATLEAENELLRERIAELEDLVGIRIDVPLLLGLTSSEAKLLGILMKRELITREMAMTALYGNRPDGDTEVEIKIVDVFICKLRKKLRPFGAEVENVWGRGYRMQQASKSICAALLEQARAA